MTPASTARTWKDAALMALAAAMTAMAVALVAPPAAHAADDSGTALAAGSAQVQSAQKRYDINELGWKLGKKYLKTLYGKSVKGKPYTFSSVWWGGGNKLYDGEPAVDASFLGWGDEPQWSRFPQSYNPHPDEGWLYAYDEDGKRFEPSRATDFDIVQENNVNVGTARVYLQGIGKYKGRILIERYKIWPGQLAVYDSYDKKVEDASLQDHAGRAWLDTDRKALAKGDVKLGLSYYNTDQTGAPYDGEQRLNKKFLSQVKPRYSIDWSKMPKSLKGKVKVNSKTGTLTLKKGKWATTAKLAKKGKLKTYKRGGKKYVGIPMKVKMTSGKNVKLVDQLCHVFKTYTVPTSKLVMVRVS